MVEIEITFWKNWYQRHVTKLKGKLIIANHPSPVTAPSETNLKVKHPDEEGVVATPVKILSLL